MRQLFIILILTFGLFGDAFSDAGNCVKYSLDVQLVDGQKIHGFVYAVSYEKRFQFKDISFLDYLNTTYPSDTLSVFKSIRQLKFPILNDGNEKCQFYFEATDEEIKILKKMIKAVQVISYMTCNICDLADEENGYYWNGIYPTVITELTKDEIDLLQTTPVATTGLGYEDTEGGWMISYSPNCKQADLIKIRDAFMAEVDTLVKNKSGDLKSIYKNWKAELRKRKIIVFKYGTAL